ncbi:glycosyl hydrolase family 18 protein [Butyrivibrio sp. VCB2006]|uniref:glycosyl hydrolase family 18 protein n=1 Tax=Butyrivibrio sp. VCB2006 TaxID=1280679 RepID=UPI00040EE2CA|nr:glycosyl hydrolase family 18 protein [Butyrivibrio sp. VCB2006]
MKKKVIPAIIIIALILVIGAIYAGQIVYQHYSYSTERADLGSYFDITGDTDVAIILGNERIEERARLLDGHYYMDFDSVQKYLNRRFYYGEADNTLFYTTATSIITTEIGSTSWNNLQGESEDVGYVIARTEGDKLYVALDYVKKYTNFSYEGFTEPNHMQLTTSWEDEQVATINKNTQLRLRGGVKSEILEDLAKGDTVVILEELENWTKVKTADSYIGYVENKRLSDTTTKSPIPVEDYVEEEYTTLNRGHKINLGFHNIGGVAGNDTFSSVVSGAKSLNVISPTWFKLNSDGGDIVSIGSSSYVKAAHDKGLEVWALVDNFTGTGDFTTSEFLSHYSSRLNAIDQLMAYAIDLGVDGINLDFETIASESGQDYIEFVRELSIFCRANNLVYSIDDYVPMHFNDHYDLKEQGIVADYVIIMGYDEHYAGSAEAGSVASLSYVENGLINTTAKVDPSKVINAVPFYTRIWHTSNGALSSEAVSMQTAKDYIANHSINMTWDAEAGQNYGEFSSSDGTLNQIWMEDATSIGQKIDSMRAQNIAGIAEWSLGMETSDVWDVIAAYIEG